MTYPGGVYLPLSGCSPVTAGDSIQRAESSRTRRDPGELGHEFYEMDKNYVLSTP